MARRTRGDGGDEVTEFPVGEEHGDEPAVTAEPTPVPTNRPKTVTYVTNQGIQEVSTDPTDLDEYEGEYKELKTGEMFALKVVEDDPQGRTHHLKNVDHYWAGTALEFRQAFEKQ